MKKLFLTRLRTGEKIEMTSTPFVVGKGRDSDYLIIGNPTISRRHAKIEKTGEEFSWRIYSHRIIPLLMENSLKGDIN